MSSVPRKRCNKCSQDKPATTQYFPPHTRTKDGLLGHCRTCEVAYRRSRSNPPEKKCSMCQVIKPCTTEHFYRRQGNSLRSSCKECSDRRKAELRSPEQQRAYYRAYHERNKEREREKASTVEFKARRNANCRRRYAQDPERHRDYFKKYHVKYKDSFREHARLRLMRIQESGNVITRAQIGEIIKSQMGKCYYCGVPFTDLTTAPHADHFIPLSRGGKHEVSNLVAACQTCNNKKYNKMPWEWMPERFSPPEGERR